MKNKIHLNVNITKDGFDTIDLTNVCEGLSDPWYRFETCEGTIKIDANNEGYEYLSRYFHALSNVKKGSPFHSHAGIEFSNGNESELKLLLNVSEKQNEHKQ